MKKVRVEVTQVRGAGCDHGLQQGDVFYLEDDGCDICMWAATAIFPMVQVLKYGGSFPFGDDPYSAVACCQGPVNTVVFKMAVEGEATPAQRTEKEK